MTDWDQPHDNPPPLAATAICAWLIPGLGHYLFGYRKRGIIVGVTLISLFISGLLIGGIDVVDRRHDTLWYLGQVLIGPLAVVVDTVHSHLDADGKPLPPTPGSAPPPYEISVGRVNELGTLYCTLAGVLNLLVILDLVGCYQEPLEDEPAPEDADRSAAQEHAP